MRDFGEILAENRKKKGYSQSDLVDLLSQEGIQVTTKAISKWETNAREPALHVFLTLCQLLDIEDIYESFFGENPYNIMNGLNEEGRNKLIEFAGGVNQTAIATSNDSIFASEQTILVDVVNGYKDYGTTVDTERPLMLYVVGKDASNQPLVIAVNGSGMNGDIIPAISADTKLTRMGRAGAETQMQTDAYSGVPTDFPQYLQKFMAQVEMSELFQRADKEVDWDFTDAEEEAVFDMKRVQNVTYWKGVRRRIKKKNAHTQKAEDIYFTEGIWTQAGKEFSFEGNPVDIKNMVTLMKHAFTGNASGKKKLLIAGSDVIEAFEQVEYNRTVNVGAKIQAYGLEFNSIISKFGTLLVVHDQSLDDMGMADKFFILDADFLRKWTMGWRVNDFDFRKSGQSDADGRGLMEICGLVLKNPKAHSRGSL